MPPEDFKKLLPKILRAPAEFYDKEFHCSNCERSSNVIIYIYTYIFVQFCLVLLISLYHHNFIVWLGHSLDQMIFKLEFKNVPRLLCRKSGQIGKIRMKWLSYRSMQERYQPLP
jgi:hypothetical protein